MATPGIGEVSAVKEVAVLPDPASFKLKQFVVWS
jgi:hypothetical protein